MIRLRGWRRAVPTAAVVSLVTLGSSLATSPALAAGSSTTSHWRVDFRSGVSGLYSFYDALTVSGRSAAWAVGGRGVAGYGSPIAAVWRNGHWSATRMPSKAVGSLQAVSADSPNDAWAVSVGDVLHWHAGTWTVARTWSLKQGPPGKLVTGVQAFSPTNVWVFGGTQYGLGTWHLRGGKWKKLTGAGRDIAAVSALSSTNMWAIGGASSGSLLHYVKGNWQTVSSPALTGLNFGAILATSPASVWVTASPADGTPGFRLLHLHGNQWTSYAIPWDLSVSSTTPDGAPDNSIASAGHGSFWIATGNNTATTKWLLHFGAGGAWSRVKLGADVMFGVARRPASGSLFGVGETPQGKTGYTDAIWAYGTTS